jgi:isopentenyl phosphate kinase
MEAKVKEMLLLVEKVPGLEVLIFSGDERGNTQRALKGENPGTRIYS